MKRVIVCDTKRVIACDTHHSDHSSITDTSPHQCVDLIDWYLIDWSSFTCALLRPPSLLGNFKVSQQGVAESSPQEQVLGEEKTWGSSEGILINESTNQSSFC